MDYYATRPTAADTDAFAVGLSAPTLAIYGADEPTVRRHAFARATDVLGPGWAVREIPRVGHWQHLEAPRDVGEVTTAFLNNAETIA